MAKQNTKDMGLVLNTQRYSVHDGHGIRTLIFLMGCPLNCPWCSNPESQGPVQQIIWNKNGVKETLGEWRTVDDVVEEVMRDQIFYDASGGGVTLSGGEVLVQYEFAEKLLKRFYTLGVSTAIETTGALQVDRIKKLLPYLDQVLFDLKIMDSTEGRSVIGYNIDTVKENFEAALAASHVKVTPRVPLIPEYTAVDNNLSEIAEYLKSVGVSEVHLLPFHQYGSQKYKYLEREYTMEDVDTLEQEQIKEFREIFEKRGITTNISGLE